MPRSGKSAYTAKRLTSARRMACPFTAGESAIALQSASADSRIEAVVAEAPFTSLSEASYDYTGIQKYPWLGKSLLAPGAWVMLARGEALSGFPSADVSPEKAVASSPFPVFLICEAEDTTLPCRHAEKIYAVATGPRVLWVVPEAYHTAALGYQPNEFKSRVLSFFADPAAAH